jgi:hypothetical protein
LETALIAGATATGNPALIAAAPILATSATTAFYKADFSRNLNGQGAAVAKAAAIAGARDGIQTGMKSQQQSSTSGGSLNPFLVPDKAKKPKKMKDQDLMSGGSFRPVGREYYGGEGFKPVGSGFIPAGGSIMPGLPQPRAPIKAPSSRPIKGSPEAMAWAQKMQAARLAKKGK